MENKLTMQPFTDEVKKELAQKCYYANVYSIERLGGDMLIKNLIKQYSIHPVLNFMCLYLMKVIKISKIENVITDRDQLEFIIRTWLGNNHDKDIREYAMIINNGITGEYGPTYNKVGIDSLGSWTKGYMENTKPKLLQRIQSISTQNTTTKTLQLVAPSTTPIPCPADIQKATDQLVKKYNVDTSTGKRSFAEQRKDKLRKYLGVNDRMSE